MKYQFLSPLLAVFLCLALAPAPLMAQEVAKKKGEVVELDAAAKAEADKVEAAKAEQLKKAAAAKEAEEKIKAEEEKKRAESKVALDSEAIFGASGKSLTMLFVLALLLESAFEVIFNWSVFLAYFNVRGIKTILMIGFSTIFVMGFGLDVVANLVAVYKSPKGVTPDPLQTGNLASQVITALILAGGSSGINTLLNKLGIRLPKAQETLTAKPPAKKAWIAISLEGRAQLARNVEVRIKELNPANLSDPPDPIAGVIRPQGKSLSLLLLRSFNRFPQSGGYTLNPGVFYQITVLAKEDGGGRLKALGGIYCFAEGAIVDFEILEFESQEG